MVYQAKTTAKQVAYWVAGVRLLGVYYLDSLYILSDNLDIDDLSFSPARTSGVESVYDLLLKELEQRSWTESQDLDLGYLRQLIGFYLC